jgi:hypothetical protein
MLSCGELVPSWSMSEVICRPSVGGATSAPFIPWCVGLAGSSSRRTGSFPPRRGTRSVHRGVRATSTTTTFSFDNGVQGVVLMCTYPTLDCLRLSLRDILASERASVAAAGLDPDQTHDRFEAKRMKPSDPGAFFHVKIDLVLTGDWARIPVRSGDVVFVRGKGLVVRASLEVCARDDHPMELVVLKNEDVELGLVRKISVGVHEQALYEPFSRIMRWEKGMVVESIEEQVGQGDAVEDQEVFTPLAHLDSGVAKVMGLVVRVLVVVHGQGRN